MKFKDLLKVMMCDFIIERNGKFYYNFIYDKDIEKNNIPKEIMEDKVVSVINGESEEDENKIELTIFLIETKK
jgi:hypothetical protein